MKKEVTMKERIASICAMIAEGRLSAERGQQMILELHQKRALRPGEVEEIYGLDAQTLAHWRCEKIGPRYAKLGHRTVLYQVEELDAFLASNRMETTGRV